MSDLDSRAQIHDLVVQFYREVVNDEQLNHVFGEVAEVDWAVHIPRLIDFWCRVLLNEPGYDGKVLEAHREVHALEPLRTELFDRWYTLWTETVDAGWSGPIADNAKTQAARFGSTLARMASGLAWEAKDSTGTQPRSSSVIWSSRR